MTTKEQTPLEAAKYWMKRTGCLGQEFRNSFSGPSAIIEALIGEVERLGGDLEMSRLGFETVDEMRVAANARAERYKGGLEEISELYREVNTLEIATARGVARIALADDAKEGM